MRGRPGAALAPLSRANGMDILWDPEPGSCTECGRGREAVRRHTCGGRHRVYCLECWNRQADGYEMDGFEWIEQESILFVYPGDGSGEGRGDVGASQGDFVH